MTAGDRFLAGAAAVWPLYVAFVLLLGAAYLVARAWQYLTQPSDYVGIVRRGRESGGDR
jgi:hypothetical protein